MDDNGIEHERLELVYFTPEYRGIVAKEDIKKDEIVLVVPYDMTISVELAQKSGFGKHMFDIELHDYMHYKTSAYLSLFLL